MVQGLYKTGEQINLAYHAAGDGSGLTPTGLVYDEGAVTHVVESTALVSALALGEKAGGVYLGGFEPDAEGEWTVVIDNGAGDGTAVKTYMVCGHNIDEVGDDAALAKDNADSATNAAQSALAKAVSADSQATIAANKATSADSQATIAAGKATDADSQATLAAGFASSAATSAAVAAVGSPATIS